MALPPNKITDRLMIKVAGFAENTKFSAGVSLEVYVNIDPEHDDWEIVEFVAREGDSLTLNRELYTVESIISDARTTLSEDTTTPDTEKGINVVLRSVANRICLSA